MTSDEMKALRLNEMKNKAKKKQSCRVRRWNIVAQFYRDAKEWCEIARAIEYNVYYGKYFRLFLFIFLFRLQLLFRETCHIHLNR